MIRFLIAASLALSLLLVLSKVDFHLPRLAPQSPTLLAPVLASAKSL